MLDDVQKDSEARKAIKELATWKHNTDWFHAMTERKVVDVVTRFFDQEVSVSCLECILL